MFGVIWWMIPIKFYQSKKKLESRTFLMLCIFRLLKLFPLILIQKKKVKQRMIYLTSSRKHHCIYRAGAMGTKLFNFNVFLIFKRVSHNKQQKWWIQRWTIYFFSHTYLASGSNKPHRTTACKTVHMIDARATMLTRAAGAFIYICNT